MHHCPYNRTTILVNIHNVHLHLKNIKHTYLFALFVVPTTGSGLPGSQHLTHGIKYVREVGKLDPQPGEIGSEEWVLEPSSARKLLDALRSRVHSRL